jgi:two-component system chemotaxis response regulator CheY
MRILIVDDEYLNRYILEQLLNEYGKCDMAANGLEAVEAFKLALDEGKPYDLVCMDLLMPQLNGHDALKQIRAYEEDFGIYGLDGLKAIIVSSKDDFDNVKNAFGLCDDYMVKPIDAKMLKMVLTKLELI